MIIDMHVHTRVSLDSPATVEDYCRAIKRFRRYHPFHGIVLTEHRVYHHDEKYKRIAEKYDILIFQGIEVDTNLGHMLLYGITNEFLRRIDISNRRIETSTIVQAINDSGGIAVPAHPFRESVIGVALEEKREEIQGISVIEELNGVNDRSQNEKASRLVFNNGLYGMAGSDAHFSNSHWFLTCATEFYNPIHTVEDLIGELKKGAFRPIVLDNSVMGKF